MRKTITSLTLVTFLTTTVFSNITSLDTTFNGTGYNLQAAVPSPQRSHGEAMAIRPNGKIVIGGDTVADSSPDKWAVMQFNADGTLDTSFGTGGSTVSTVGRSASAHSMILQPDGKILLAGYSIVDQDNRMFDMTVIRYTADGFLDTTFNSTGYHHINFGGSSWDTAYDILLRPDGKMILVGSTGATNVSPMDIALVRLNSDGTLDTTFNGTGMVSFPTPADDNAEVGLLIAGDKIVIGGRRFTTKEEFLLMRVNSDGTIDSSFGTGGTTTTSFGTQSIRITAMDRQSNGKLIAGGSGWIARYSANGILDPTFGSTGAVQLSVGGLINDIHVLANDKIHFASGGGTARLMPDGRYDTLFNNNSGIGMIPGGNSTCSAMRVAMHGDKVLVGGRCSVSDTSQIAIFRFKETRTKRFLDFVGDGSSDLAFFRPSNSQWWRTVGLTTQPIAPTTFGLSTDRPVPADYTGEGITDIAVFRPTTGEWFILRSDGGAYETIPFGTSGDVPVPADYDGDDIADLAVFRPSTGQWYIRRSTGGTVITAFGSPGDKPVPSDYDGDFKTDIAIYRPSNGQWWMMKSTDSSVLAFQFGNSDDKPVAGDYTGDSKSDGAFFRPSTGEWFVLRSEDYSYYSVPFGTAGDLPIPGNYLGDVRFDFTVFRPSTNFWYVQQTGGSYQYREFGISGDRPVASSFVP